MANNTLIEGLDNNHKTGLLQVIIPAADALETVNVTTSNYDAEFGRAGGAVTNVTLKSGTNELKGSAFFFGNTEATNASDYFTHLKAPTKFFNSGFTLGGPIVKQQAVLLRRLPAHDRQRRLRRPRHGADDGDAQRRFQRGVAAGIYDPLTGDVNGNGRTAFANNIRSAGSDQPDRPRLLAFIPEPNIAAPLGQNNYQKAQTREKTTDGFDAKVNYTVNEKDQLSYRLSFMRPVVFDPGSSATTAVRPTAASPAPAPTQLQQRGHLDARHQRQDVLDVRGGLNYYHNVTSTQGNGLTTSTDVGIPGANLDDSRAASRRSRSAATAIRCSGFSASQPWDRSEKTWNVTTTLTRLLARTRSRSAASGATTATCCCRRRTPAARAASSRSTPPAPAIPASRPRSAASPTRWPRSCSTGRTACSAT